MLIFSKYKIIIIFLYGYTQYVLTVKMKVLINELQKIADDLVINKSYNKLELLYILQRRLNLVI